LRFARPYEKDLVSRTDRAKRSGALRRFRRANPPARGLAFGYGMIGAERIDEGVRRLARVLR